MNSFTIHNDSSRIFGFAYRQGIGMWDVWSRRTDYASLSLSPSHKCWSRIHWPILYLVVVVMLRCLWSNQRAGGATGNGSRLNGRGVVYQFSSCWTPIRLIDCNPKSQPRLEFPFFRPSILYLFIYQIIMQKIVGTSKPQINGLKYARSLSSSTSSSHKQMPNENQ